MDLVRINTYDMTLQIMASVKSNRTEFHQLTVLCMQFADLSEELASQPYVVITLIPHRKS